MNKIKTFLANKRDLKDRVYYITMGLACVCMVISIVADYLQGFGNVVLIILSCSLVVMLVLMYASLKYNIEKIGRHILAYLFGTVVFPVLFITSGGVTSGMVLVYLFSVIIVAILLEGKSRVTALIICVAIMELSIVYSCDNEYKIEKLSYKESVIDFGVTLLILSVTLVYIIAAILRAYDTERKKTEELYEKLKDISVKDELSGLYNRRELFRRLDSIYETQDDIKINYSKKNCYIAMFDIDNFKSINDTYGHQFGDEVLATISHVLMENANENIGELASRYGGEEFVNVILAEDKPTAFERVEEIRREVEAIRWEGEPDLVVTISGGFVSCELFNELKGAIHRVDELLYTAKKEGKNQIRG